MARDISWSLDNFNGGVHTDPSKVAKGEVYASVMKNLRVNDRGALVTRFGQTIEAEIASGNITGIAVFERESDPFVLILNSLNELRIAEISSGTIINLSAPLVTDANLSGRLSGVLVSDDAIVFTSEGNDRGCWVDLSAWTPTAQAYPLGFDKPSILSVSVSDVGGSGFLDEDSYYFYMLTYYRANSPFAEKSSVPSNILSIRTNASGSDDRTVRLDVLPTAVLNDTGITSIRVWRSEGVAPIDLVNGVATGGHENVLVDTTQNFGSLVAVGNILLNTTDKSQGNVIEVQGGVIRVDEFVGGTDNVFQPGDSYIVIPGTLPFHLVNTLPSITTTFDDGTMHDSELVNQPSLDLAQYLKYAVAPAGIQSIALYNDRLFCAGHGTSVVYSVIENGEALWWAFAPTNEILSHRGKVHAVAEYREILTILGASANGRLVGTSPFDFDIDWSEKTGVVDAFSWLEADDLLWYVSSSGFYVFDGVRSVRFGDAVTQLFAEQAQKPISTANLVYLPTDELLVDVFHVANSERTTLLYHLLHKTWRTLDSIAPAQLIAATVQGERQIYYAWTDTAFVRRYWHGYEVNTLLSPIPTQDETDASLTLADVSYEFATQVLRWQAQGLEERKKHFQWIELATANETTLAVVVLVNGVQVINESVTVPASPVRPFRVYVGRFGEDIKVRVLGAGAVELRRLVIVGKVV